MENGPERRRRFATLSIDALADELAVAEGSQHSYAARVEMDRRLADAQLKASDAQKKAADAQVLTAWLTLGSVVVAAAGVLISTFLKGG